MQRYPTRAAVAAGNRHLSSPLPAPAPPANKASEQLPASKTKNTPSDRRNATPEDNDSDDASPEDHDPEDADASPEHDDSDTRPFEDTQLVAPARKPSTSPPVPPSASHPDAPAADDLQNDTFNLERRRQDTRTAAPSRIPANAEDKTDGAGTVPLTRTSLRLLLNNDGDNDDDGDKGTNERFPGRREPTRRPREPVTLPPATRETSACQRASREPTTRPAATREPPTRPPAPRNPTTRAPATRDPAARAPATRDPATRPPAARNPARRAPATRDPATRAQATHDPATRAPATREPTTRAPAAPRPQAFLPPRRRTPPSPLRRSYSPEVPLPPPASPLPPSSPPEVRSSPVPPATPPSRYPESDIDDSDDDYERQKAEARKRQNWRERHGYSPTPASDEGDMEDLQDMMEEIEQNGYHDGSDTEDNRRGKSGSRKVARQSRVQLEALAPFDGEQGGSVQAKRGSKKTTLKKKAAGKGKAKAKGSADEAEPDGSDEDSDEEDFKSGPIPQDIIDRLTVAHENFEKEVQKLASECGKSSQTLHRHLGTVIKTTRQPCPWNMFQMWHSTAHPKPETMSVTEYNRQCRQSFAAACPQLDKTQLGDSNLVRKALPWLIKWYNDTMEQAVVTWRDNGKFKSKVQKAVKPMVKTARSIHQELGVHVFGYVIDPQSQASYLWAATNESKAMRSSQHFDIGQTIRDYETLIRAEEMKVRGLDPGRAIRPRLVQGDDEAKRDAHRRKFADSSAGFHCIAAGLLESSKAHKFTMHWGPVFLKYAYQGQFRIVNYPTALVHIGQVIGEHYETKKVGMAQYNEFMPAFEVANGLRSESADIDPARAVAIEAWSPAEKQQPLAEQGEIPLVVDTSGQLPRNNGEGVRGGLALHPANGTVLAPRVPALEVARAPQLLAVPPRHAAVPPRALQVPALKVVRGLQLLAVPPRHAAEPPRALQVPALKVARGLQLLAMPPRHAAVPPHHAAVPPRALQVPALKVAWALQVLAVPPRHAVAPPRVLASEFWNAVFGPILQFLMRRITTNARHLHVKGLMPPTSICARSPGTPTANTTPLDVLPQHPSSTVAQNLWRGHQRNSGRVAQSEGSSRYGSNRTTSRRSS
ncbi:hypothetical protein GGX14DRAFT_677863 [Mycena pura]|uniref:Uncharacterized protein n=1 Tax=Mycena pura TaxID=153505 RepID=A0AAD6Y7H0_9AGAR|nr:hypothetical protein GGX14DRAFT_677863 [Mycena pura]